MADEGKDGNKGSEWQTDEEIDEGWMKGRLKQSMEVETEMEIFPAYTVCEEVCVLSVYLWIHEELTSVSGSWPREMRLVHKSRFIHH